MIFDVCIRYNRLFIKTSFQFMILITKYILAYFVIKRAN